jgi:hypothetical protein
MNWINLAQNRDDWGVVNGVVRIRDLKRVEGELDRNFFTC